MANARFVHASQEYALVVTAGADVRRSQQSAMVTWSTSATRVRVSDYASLVVYATEPFDMPRVSQEYAVVVWGETPPGEENRTRAWTYTMDGHVFYVLDLGLEGTWVFDYDTNQWSEFKTEGYDNWNMHVGIVWQDANRVVAGDLLYSYVWEMAPTDLLDEEFRQVEHIATGGVVTRSRIGLDVASIRVSGSIGQMQDGTEGINTYLSFSDNAGASWSSEYDIVIAPGQQGSGFELNYRSLGTFIAPGRVVKFRDLGGMLRIDGADIFIDSFDDEQELSSSG